MKILKSNQISLGIKVRNKVFVNIDSRCQKDKLNIYLYSQNKFDNDQAHYKSKKIIFRRI